MLCRRFESGSGRRNGSVAQQVEQTKHAPPITRPSIKEPGLISQGDRVGSLCTLSLREQGGVVQRKNIGLSSQRPGFRNSPSPLRESRERRKVTVRRNFEYECDWCGLKVKEKTDEDKTQEWWEVSRSWHDEEGCFQHEEYDLCSEECQADFDVRKIKRKGVEQAASK